MTNNKRGGANTDERLSLKGNGIILLELAFISMMVMFVEIMLVPALPKIAQEFPQDASWVSWILAAYMLVGAVATPLLGRLGDIYGKKRVMLIALSVYVAGLVGCSIAWSIPSLIGFRAVQGIGMGMFPLAFGIIRDTFPRRLVPMAIGIISAMFSVGVSIGLLAGGYIVAVLSWRDCFYIVTPLLAIIGIVAFYTIKADHVRLKCGIDVVGAGTLGTSIFCLLFALTEGQTWGWGDIKTLGFLAFFVAMFVTFVAWERRVKDPIVRLSLMANPGVLGVNLTALFVGVAMFLMFQTLPFFLMTPKSLGGFALADAFMVGLYMFPTAIGQLIFAPLAGKWSKRIGADNVLIIGIVLLAVGYGMLIVMHGSALDIALSMFVSGSGLGLCMVSFINVIAMTAPKNEFGIASGMNTLFRVVGGSIGPVIGAVIMAGFVVAWIPSPSVGPISMTTETGYIWAWVAGLVASSAALVIAIVLRPGKGMDFEKAPDAESTI